MAIFVIFVSLLSENKYDDDDEDEAFTVLTRKLCCRKDDCAMRAILDREPLRRYGHSKLSKMAAAAILNLFESKIAPLDPPSPKTPPYNQT